MSWIYTKTTSVKVNEDWIETLFLHFDHSNQQLTLDKLK